jgi:hypothetical protein
LGGVGSPSLNEEALFDPVLPASTELSVIDNPTAPVVQVPARALAPFPHDRSAPATGSAPGGLALSGDGVRLIVAPLSGRMICSVTQTEEGSGFRCGPRDGCLARGAAISGGRYGDLPPRRGLVGNGIERVSTDDGRVARLVNNVCTFSPANDIRRLTFGGPVGTFSLPVPRSSDEPPRFTPDRTMERELLGIELSGGGRASIRVAPNVGGGRRDWFYLKGDVRSSTCRPPV